MKPHNNIGTNRQELRRNARRNTITRCEICGKVSTRCNKKVHALAASATTDKGGAN